MLLSSATFRFLLGPVITLVYPLYGSIRALEGTSKGDIQQWLTYWVLFTLIRILELLLHKLLHWLLIWPYAKVTVALWLVFPYYGGAAHAYDHYVRHWFSLTPRKLYGWLISRNKEFITSRSDVFLVAAERYIQGNGADALVAIINEGKSKEVRKDMVIASPQIPKNGQREWTCVLCLVTTTNEDDLGRHHRGQKHKKKELRLNNKMSKQKGGLGLPMCETDMANIVQDFNQIKEAFVRKLKRQINPFARPLRWCTWEKPEIGWTKLNTDGSIDPNKAGLGGLLRDHLGCATCAFASKAPRDDIFSVEVWAIWRGLVLALGQGVARIWVESDSMSVVQVINHQLTYPLKDGSCLKQIWQLLNKFEKYQVSHSWREANRAADHLAKMNHNARDVVLWPGDFPEPLCNIISEDADGKMYLRL